MFARQADLGRGTFYLHYKDVYDLHDSIENELCTELYRFFDEAYPVTNPDNLTSLINNITQYMDKNREIFMVLSKPENSGKTLSNLKKMFNEKILGEIPTSRMSELDTVESVFVVAGVIGVIEDWLNKGLPFSQNQLSIMLHNILMRFAP